MSKIFPQKADSPLAKKFPECFLWGAATSAHQVEGNNHNDWTEWEKENAQRLSKESGGKYPPENYISGKACDHYNRYEEDFDIAKSLSHNAHRFSIEWSRVEPEEGKFDSEVIEHYRDVIRALRERGIEPFVTLWHWTLPLWISKNGGWENRKTVRYFARYCEKVVYALREDVKFWITLNEPVVHAKISYLEGRWPPQKKNFFSFLRVFRNLAHGHNLAYSSIKKIKPESQIGIAHNMSFFEVERKNFISLLVKWFGEWWKNYRFLNAISKCQDFIGFNYYSHYKVGWRKYKIKTEEISDMGWAMYPKGIYLMLSALKKYRKPLFITENGLADARDQYRSWFIIEHLKWVSEAIKDNVDVRGYFYWSLLDNFEWSDGFWPRFGLVEIDYETLERKPRPSSKVYAEIAKANGINETTKVKEEK